LLAVSGIALAVMALVSAMLGWLMAGRVLRPLHVITAVSRQISEENLHERLAAEGPDDELKDLSDTIDGLLGRLDAAFTAQRRFVANASHELRTPLTMMRTSLDVAEAKPGQVSPQVTTLAGKVREGLDLADRLLDGLLALARAQHGTDGRREMVDLSRILAEVIGAHDDSIASRALLVRQIGDSAVARGNLVLLARLADNLIDNAIRYSDPGGWIRAETEVDEATGTARIVVENDGPVLDEARVRELAQPFRRFGPDRTGSETGSGLGLSIVEAIASAHGGSLKLRAQPHGGLRVTVELPAAHAGSASRLAMAGAIR
jgi:signal transduction histidine kinase